MPMQNLHTNGHSSIRNPKVQTSHISDAGEPGLLTQRSAVWTEEGALTAPGGWPSGRRAARRRLVGRRRHVQAAPSRWTRRAAEKAGAGRGCTCPGR